MNHLNISRRTAALAAAWIAVSGAHAQTNIDPAHKHSWQENCGWMNWRDAGAGVQGVQVRPAYLQGFIWCENTGWICLGDGTPGGATGYLNATGLDYGVNVAPAGNLSGYGWAENVGWINFDTAAELGPQRARYDRPARRLRGFAWGENIGWVNLDHATEYIAVACYANCDGSTGSPVLSSNDFICFINAFAAGDSYANCDGSTAVPSLTPNDFLCFVNRFSAGCS